MHHLPRVLLCILPLLAAACSDEDEAAPPPPSIDFVESPTGALRQVLTGSAEYGALVRIQGGAGPVETRADAYTARFQAEVELQPGTSNVLSVTATDAAGNTSEPATVTLVQADPAGAAVISGLRVNGVLCTPGAQTPEGCNVRDGDVVSFDVVALRPEGILEVAYSAFFPSTQTLRARRVAMPAGTTSTTVPFEFRVDSDTVESVDVVASITDGRGRAVHGRPITLRVTLGITTTAGRSVSVVTSRSTLSQPSDSAVLASGDSVVLSEGNDRVLRVPAATSYTLEMARFADMQFVARAATSAGGERLFVSRPGDGRVFQMEPDGSGLTGFADPGGQPARGLGVLAPTPARGWANAGAAGDGAQLVLRAGATTETYELDSDGSCTASGTLACVSIAVGATAQQKTDALAAAIQGRSALSAAVAGPGPLVVLSARARGEAGNGIELSSPASALAVSAPTLLGGNGEALYVANDADLLVRRYAQDSGPHDAVTNQGSFSVGAPQWGLQVRDVYGAPSPLLEHLVLYAVVDVGGGMRALRAREVRREGTGTGSTVATSTLFTLSATTGTQPLSFGRLWDLALTAQGCLLASDTDRGHLYVVDVRQPFSTTPTAALVASGLREPQGLALDTQGNLQVSLRGADAVVRIAPSPDPADCF